MKLSPVLPLSSEPRAASVRSVRRDEALRRTGLQLRHRDPPGASTAPVRAVAVAHERCNAVGTVELSCGAKGLWVKFLRISPFNDGYVPYPAASGHTLNVPYEQVVRAVTDPSGLVHLTFDPSSTPFNKLVLAGLARDIRYDHHSSFLRRARIESALTLAAIALWMPLAFGLRALAPSVAEPLVLGVAATVSLLLHAMRRDIASRWVLFGARSERLRSELLADLALRLGPERVRDAFPETPAVPAEKPAPRDSADASALRPLFATAGIVAAVTLVAILVSKTLLSVSWDTREARHDELYPAEQPSPVAEAVPVQALAAGSLSAEPRKPAVVLPPCSCERADSALWSGGVPQLSILSTNRPGKSSERRPRVYPEIAVVNNGDRELNEVMLTVDFVTSARDGQPARRTDQEGLLYDKLLRPGQAVKWRTKGRGDDFIVTSSISGRLGETGLNAAPADAFHKLLTAHTPSVRLHGAKMLAWYNDPRAREAIEQLESERREEMSGTLAMLTDATRPLRVCSVRATPTEVPTSLYVEACVFNASPEARERPALVARSLDGTGGETRWVVEASIGPGSGVRTSGRVEHTGKLPESGSSAVQLTVEP